MVEQGEKHNVTLITGAAKRIGRALALDLAQNGSDIAIHYNGSADAAEHVVEEVFGLGRKAIALPADLADIKEVETLIPRCREHLGSPNCLINNASRFDNDEIDTLTPKGWDAHQNINLRAPIFLAQHFARTLPARQEGVIINLIDQRVLKPRPLFFSYSVSKAGLWSATRMLAQALAPRIRVNAVGPGPVLQSIHQSKDQFDTEQRGTLLGRGASPKDIAKAVRFILDAPAMTGQMIVLDGGQHLNWRDEDRSG
ncbi:MAG: SDR family oxidoreductase [Methyloligellaceae bacterium]